MQTETLAIRKFPYPYRSMLAICSDLDETRDWPTYFEISRFLNTTEKTRIGTGVGLEVGNTMYFDMPPGQLSYWNIGDAERRVVRAMIRSGHIDCFHSYGDEALRRSQVERTLAELEAHECRLKVWVDHATAVTNFGADIMRGSGDLEHHSAYHADRTIEHGVRFVWLGRVTSIIGQNARYNPLAVLSASHPVASTRTMLKDVAKHTLARNASSKYRMHAGNRLMRSVRLRSGHEVMEFLRCNPHPGGVSIGDNAPGMTDVLSRKNLESLIRRQGVSIVYTHLGKKLVPGSMFSAATCAAIRRLAEYAQDRSILVTTTRRVLEYWHAREQLNVSVRRDTTPPVAELRLPPDGNARGITVYWDGPSPKIVINGRLADGIEENPPDETGRRSFSVRWEPLQWTHANV